MRCRPMPRVFALAVWMVAVAANASWAGPTGTPKEAKAVSATSTAPASSALATFGGGCFWCVEAVFQEVDGVLSVESGYAGGPSENPTYEAVCTGQTGHAEVCQIRFDPAKVRYDDLLEIFWKTHDPTTLNRQGNDSGTQYRSAVFFHDEAQRALAEKYRKELDASGIFSDPIVTTFEPYTKFFKAEAYHQNYFRQNPNQPYCMFVVGPKVEKFRKIFKGRLKTK